MSSIQELKKIADRACFLNHNFFHRNMSMDWFKLYLLFYDHFVFESDYTTNTSNGLVFKYPEVWEQIEKRSIFLQEVKSYINRKELNEWATKQLRPFIVTKSNKPNKGFFRSLRSRMKLRQEGASDTSGRLDLIQEWGSPEFWGWEKIAIDEFVDAYLSVWVRQSTGIPSVLDSVGDWIVRRVSSNFVANDTALNTFEKVVIDEIPNFYNLSWDSILQLRESKYRKHCVQYIREVPFDNSIREDLKDSMWRLVTEVATESSVKKSAMKGLIGNLPGLPVNPMGLAFSSRDTLNIRRRIKTYGWIYFLSEIRRVDKEKGEAFTLLPRDIRSRSD